MSKKENQAEKKIAHKIHIQFRMAALVCLVVIIVLCIGMSRICRNMISLREYENDMTIALADGIDNIVVEHAADISGLRELEQAYHRLSSGQQELVTKQRYDKLTEAIWLAEQMEKQDISLVVKDKSKNGFDMKPAKQDGIRIKAYEGRTAFEGHADVSGNGAKEIFDRLLDGRHSFTIEAEINPNGRDDLNMIMSKGDNCVALRLSEHSVYFFIKEDQGNWNGAYTFIPEEQMHSWLHVAGVYDKEYVSSYLEGSGITTEKVNAFLPSDFPLGIGYCPESNRKSSVSIRKFCIYSESLTEEELKERKYGPDSDSVVLWYDFDDCSYEGIDVPAEGIRCYVDSMQLEEGEEKCLLADRIPYYASGNILYHSDNPEVAAVSRDGVLSAVNRGKATVTVSVEGTDFSVEIPVTVGNVPKKILFTYEQLNYCIFVFGVLLFVCALFVIAIRQRSHLICCLSRLSDEISSIGGERKGPGLPDFLDDAEHAIQCVEENFRKKEYEAREAEQRKNDLVVYLAHDLKTPIASLIGYLTLLRDEKQISPDLHRHYVEVALNNSERLDELINEFFEITRFNISHIILNYEPINLIWLIEQLVYEFEPILAHKGLSCKLDAPRDVIVRCDADKMERVFENLLRNAVNYSYRDTQIRIQVTVGDEIAIVFMNKGKHISEEQLARVFEQFYRLDHARSTSTGGSGLGLAIAKQIVELHRGTICAESRGEEICFTVTLPLYGETEGN